ncbi:MAG TPA: methyltransferase domain-containing protein [Bacteroidales bacterium]|nr:methyltransferase domain-containing protein [Bacteroidales bacterium]
MEYKEINKRYTELAETSCCLSCGGAVNHAGIKPGEVCVDLGSGRGTDVIRMAEKTGPQGYAFGIDISEGMIKKSNDTAQRLATGNVSFIYSTLEHIKLESAIADVIISNCTINHSSDKQKVWNEIFRILKDNGRFVVSDIYSVDPVPEEFRNDPVAVAECWAGAVTRDEYIQQIVNAGFSDVKIIEESSPYEKGRATVSSWTITGIKQLKSN